MTKYKRVSRRFVNEKAGPTKTSKTVARLGFDSPTDAEMKRFGKEQVKIPMETGPTLQKQNYTEQGVRKDDSDAPVFGPRASPYNFKGKRKKSGFTKFCVGLGVTVPLILLVVYHYSQLTVTCNGYF